MMISQQLIILGKFPKEGNVKTRLGQTIGHNGAVKIYKRCAEKIFTEISQITDQVTPFFYYGNSSDQQLIETWVGDKFICVPPNTVDIEEHLLTAFTERFSQGAKKVVSIATDVPNLTAKIILEAFQALEKYDVVIGPDHKNGFYLFGIKQLYLGVFQHQYQNKDQMVPEEIARIKQLGLNYYVLPTLVDIDTNEDLITLTSE